MHWEYISIDIPYFYELFVTELIINKKSLFFNQNHLWFQIFWNKQSRRNKIYNFISCVLKKNKRNQAEAISVKTDKNQILNICLRKSLSFLTKKKTWNKRENWQSDLQHLKMFKNVWWWSNLKDCLILKKIIYWSFLFC